MFSFSFYLNLFIICLLFVFVSGHVEFAVDKAPIGGFDASLRIGHGCYVSDSTGKALVGSPFATTSISVIVPLNVTSIRAAPVTGASLSITSDSVTKNKIISYVFDTPLLSIYFQYLPLFLTIPNLPIGTNLYFITTQNCTTGQTVWNQASGNEAEATSPAPHITIISNIVSNSSSSSVPSLPSTASTSSAAVTSSSSLSWSGSDTLSVIAIILSSLSFLILLVQAVRSNKNSSNTQQNNNNNNSIAMKQFAPSSQSQSQPQSHYIAQPQKSAAPAPVPVSVPAPVASSSVIVAVDQDQAVTFH